MARATAFAIEPLLDAARVGPGVRVLDVGCGPGRSRPRRRRAARRSPASTSPRACSPRRAAATRRSSSCSPTPRTLPFADGAFDVALGAFVVNHLPHPERAAGELAPRRAPRRARDVGPGGRGRRSSACPRAPPRDLDADVPPGPDSLSASPTRASSPRLIGGSRQRDHADAARRRRSTSSGTASAAAPSAPPPASQRATPDTACARPCAPAELAEPYRTATGYELPITIRIAA